MSRKSIPLNITRTLWAQCGGFCQNPECNSPLFREVDNNFVSLANVAHIIGHGASGPRSDHDLATIIDKDGIDNLIMLCLGCHKVIDELEKKFNVEKILSWKKNHADKIISLFAIPNINDEQKLLAEVNDLLEQNSVVFKEYGPYSDNMVKGEGGDGLIIWRNRCFDTILPNNQRIIQIIERNKRNFPYPWDVYRQMLLYKIHVDAFQDNCLTNNKVNDYKLFPKEFDHFVKTRLGISSQAPELVAKQELEYRHNQVQIFIDRFFNGHSSITNLVELNRSTMLVELKNGKTLKVFVTNTYYFTDYTLDKVLEVDPAVDAIICSSPVGQYSYSVKEQCIGREIGLFTLPEFMGAISKSGENYLNFLLKSDQRNRCTHLWEKCTVANPPRMLKVYAMGSFLRKYIYRDIDLIIVYQNHVNINDVRQFESRLTAEIDRNIGTSDITVTSEKEFSELKLVHDNLTQIYPQNVN